MSPVRLFAHISTVRRSAHLFRRLLVEGLESRIVFSLAPASGTGDEAVVDAAFDSDTLMGPIKFRSVVSSDEVWSTSPGVVLVEGKESYIHPTSFNSVVLDEPRLLDLLSTAPLEFTELAETAAVRIELPTPDGGYARFRIVSSPIMAPELAVQFPEIQTFSGQGIDDPAATLRFDITPAGFHAQILSPLGAYYVDPFWHLDTSAYISYYKRDLPRPEGLEFIEEDDHFGDIGKSIEGEGVDSSTSSGLAKGADTPPQARSGTQLRVYDLANAATAEYTAFHGGTVALGQAAIVTAVNRVTGIYEKELSVRLVLVANNSALVYTNAATDPYTNGNASALLSENQANIDTVIGNANYDIGHVFSTGGGGLAGLGVVGLTGSKARGETGLGSPIGDAFYVDYVAHEMGHQFGGNHTFNSPSGSCSGNRSAATAYEPGSGSTIMAYAGICAPDNLQANSDPYFHSISFDEITNYIASGAAAAAATLIATGNSVPRVNAGPDYVIPAQTNFVLRAAGADGNSTDVLTYNWEQRDLGVSTTLAAADNGTSPIIRSFNPQLSSERTVPRLAELLNNTTAVGEKLPTAARAMRFRATARDNRAGGGAINTDDMVVTVVNTGAPFLVTSPNTAVTWPAGSTQTVTWNVAGTNAAPINTSNVNIWMSIDGGQTFPLRLATNVSNDGSETVTMPGVSTTQARIKVEPTNSIYFDVSNANFTVSGGTNTPPVLGSIANRLIDANTSTGGIDFTLHDIETPDENLVVTAASSNPLLLPASGIVLSGTGSVRTLTLTPALGQYGTTTVFVNATDAGGLTSVRTFQLYVEGVLTCAPIESFDGVTAPALPAGWFSSASGVAANWITSNTSSDAGSNNAFVPDPSSIGDSQLTSPAIAITVANRTIQFRNSYNLESTYDGAVMEISIDEGAFADVITAGGSFIGGGYNSTISTGFASPIATRSAWSGNSGGYITTTLELPLAAVGHSVRLRFRMASDNSTAGVGWRVDTIQGCGYSLPSALSITATSANKNEGNSGTTPFDFVVSRVNDVSSALTVQYAVVGSGARPATADDFGGALPSGTLSFAANENSKTLTINIAGDTQIEGSEGFAVSLSGPTAGATIDIASASGVILDDDNSPPTDVLISSGSISENSPVGSSVGSFSTVDINSSDLFAYTFVAGTSGPDNDKFSIVGNSLRTATSLDFESKSSYLVFVRSTDLGGLFVEKSLTIAVNDLVEMSASPKIGDGTAQRSLIKSIAITLDGAVDVLPGAFAVDRLGTDGGTVTTVASILNETITLEFSGGLTRGGGALSDGYYRLTIDGSKIARNGRQLDINGDGIGGDTYTLGAVESDNFFALYADTTGDGIVGVAEFGQFRSAFGKTSVVSGFDARFEYDGDGVVGVSDFGQFRSRFGKVKLPF